MIPNLKSKLNSLRSPADREEKVPAAAEETCQFRGTLYPYTDVSFGGPLESALGLCREDITRLCLTPLYEGATLREAVFLDTETTGLSGGAGTVAFLIGLGRFTREGFYVSQYWMRDYQQEPDMLEKVQKTLSEASFLVSYNGKSFDGPLLETRMIMNRLRMKQLPHLDLLHASRRLLKRRLRNCSLGSVETGLLGITRDDDIPGALIPELYFNFLKDGDETPLEKVFLHNAQDVASMPLLLSKLCGIMKQPEQSFPEDRLSCAILFERLGDYSAAVDAYTSLWREDPEAAVRLSLLYKRDGRLAEACAVWAYMEQAGWRGTFPYIEMAKALEHTYKDYPGAIFQVETCLRQTRAYGVGFDGTDASLRYRLRRLQQKNNGGQK